MTPSRRIGAVLACLLAPALVSGPVRADALLDQSVGFTGTIAWLGSGAPGMVIAAVRNGETAFAGMGETARGSGVTPDINTMMRIASISKVFCGDVLASLVADGEFGLTDPVQSHLPDFTIPEKDGRTLRLIDLATQTSGLPRELKTTGGTQENPYAGHTRDAMKAEMAGGPFLFAPGTGAHYSNLGFDLLGASISEAFGKPYFDVLHERVLNPRGMADTVSNPRPDDAGRLMQGHDFDGTPLPFIPTVPTKDCASGLYTSAADMQKWLRWHLTRGGPDDAWRMIDHAAWVSRDGLSPVLGLDDGGARMDAMALGWVVLKPQGTHPLILHKSGGRQGVFSYVAIAPTRGIGVFAAMNQFNTEGFNAMVERVNKLIFQLAPR